MARSKTADSSKQLSRRALMLITREVTTKTPRIVWQHEIPILESIFGEGNVTPLDPETMDEGYSAKPSPDLLPFNKVQDQVQKPSQSVGIGFVFVGDARGEYERLRAAYGTDEKGVPHVEAVYGRFQDGKFAAMVGRADVEDLPEAQLRELAKSYGYIPTTHKDSTEAEKAEEKAKRLALAALDHDGLVKLAEELSISL